MNGYGPRDGVHWNDRAQRWEWWGGPPVPQDTGPLPGGAGPYLVRPAEPAPPLTAPGHALGDGPGYGPGYGPGPEYFPETGEWRYGGTGGGGAPVRPKGRTGLVVGAVVAVLVVGTLGGRLIWGGGDAPATAAATVTDTEEPPAETDTPSGDDGDGEDGWGTGADGGPTDTATDGTRSTDGPGEPSGTDSGTPDGFEVVGDPKGFVVAVPEGWHRTESDQGIFYNSPDGASLLQIFPVTEGNLTPYESLRAVSENGRANRPGYEEVRLERVTDDTAAHTDAAELVYVYTRDDGSRRKVVDRAFVEPDGQQYALLAAGPETDWPRQRQVLTTALEYFTTGTD
ncbi:MULTISPECIES: hypothetical protein [unclassified Streptomyces]|uniref:hypothetical protein n=1 Tax=unclassified Streptomyces TaxID=2593676 RepID=UPI00166016D0|nr:MULTISPECIES: hypothetical protein [unclassified Streptomyces]MBD0710964.1 hypothetical protein [Streptomyces sp. CBMA291]MBD0717499.1 hypothetical protein [Streptomyces sp. CBMA370]